MEEIYLWHPIKYVTESIRIQENIVLKAREFNQITLNLSMGTIDIQFWVILKRVTTTTQPPPPPPPTYKKCPRNPTHPKYTSIHPHLLLPNDKKCPHTPTHPKYTSTHPHPPRPTHIKCPPTPTYPKYTFTQLHPPIKCTHPKCIILINVLKCSRTAFNTTVPLVPTIKEKSPFRTYSVINSYFNSRSLWSLEKV